MQIPLYEQMAMYLITPQSFAMTNKVALSGLVDMLFHTFVSVCRALSSGIAGSETVCICDFLWVLSVCSILDVLISCCPVPGIVLNTLFELTYLNPCSNPVRWVL